MTHLTAWTPQIHPDVLLPELIISVICVIRGPVFVCCTTNGLGLSQEVTEFGVVHSVVRCGLYTMRKGFAFGKNFAKNDHERWFFELQSWYCDLVKKPWKPFTDRH